MPKVIGFESFLQASEEYEGFCTTCGDFTRGECEPDGREYECPDCGERTVYGAEEAMMMGLLEISHEDDFPEED